MTLYPINSLPHSGFLIAGFAASFSLIFLVQSKKHINQKPVSFQKIPLVSEVQTVKKFTATEIIGSPIDYWNSIFKPFFTDVFNWLPLEDFLNSRIVCHRWKEESGLVLVGKQFSQQLFKGFSFKFLFQLKTLEKRFQNMKVSHNTSIISKEDHLEVKGGFLIKKTKHSYSIQNLKENTFDTFETDNHIFFDPENDRYLEIVPVKPSNPFKIQSFILTLKKISNSEEINSLKWSSLYFGSDSVISDTFFFNEHICIYTRPFIHLWNVSTNTLESPVMDLIGIDCVLDSKKIIKSNPKHIDVYNLCNKEIEFSYQTTNSILENGIINEYFYFRDSEHEFKCINLKSKKLIWCFEKILSVKRSDVGIYLMQTGGKFIYLDLENKSNYEQKIEYPSWKKLYNHFLFYEKNQILKIYNLKTSKIIRQIYLSDYIRDPYKEALIKDILFTQEHFIILMKVNSSLQTVIFSF